MPEFTPGQLSTPTLRELIELVNGSEIALPEFQRPQVWGDSEKKELIVSLCVKIPIGSFLLWEFKATHENHQLTKLRTFEHIDLIDSSVRYLLIDGQQRLSFLSSLQDSVWGQTHLIAFLDSDEGVVRPVVEKMSSSEVSDPSCEVRISDLAGHNDRYISMLRENFRPMANNFRASLSNTEIPVHVIEKEKKRSEVVFIYQTANLSGKALTAEDFAEAALAFLYPDLPTKIQSFLNRLEQRTSIEDITIKMSRKTFIKSMLDDIYKNSSFSDCRKMGLDIMNMRIIEIPGNRSKGISEQYQKVTGTMVKKSFEDVKRSFEKIADLISTSWEVDSHSCLLTNEIIMMSARYRYWHNSGQTPTSSDIGKLSKRMMLSMAFKPTTGGSTQKITNECCELLRTDDPWNRLDILLGLSSIKKEDFGEIDEDVKGKSNHKTTGMLFHLIKLNIFRSDCFDIFDNSRLVSSNFVIQDIDHFYPKKKLAAHEELTYRKDHIANFVLMKLWSNRAKGSKWPYDVIEQENAWPNTQNERDNFDNQCLPRKTNSGPWTPAPNRVNSEFRYRQYLDFLRWRTKELAARLNSMLEEIEQNGFN